MSTVGQVTQKLKQDLQNELTTANQLLLLISHELEQIKYFTNPGGQFETNINLNASIMATLAKMQQINIENLPPLSRKNVLLNKNINK